MNKENSPCYGCPNANKAREHLNAEIIDVFEHRYQGALDAVTYEKATTPFHAKAVNKSRIHCYKGILLLLKYGSGNSPVQHGEKI